MAITKRASIYSPGYVIGNGGSDIDAAITDEFYKKMPVKITTCDLAKKNMLIGCYDPQLKNS